MLISQLIQNSERPFFSLEFFPPADTSQWESFFAVAEELGALGPLFVSVTYGAGGSRQGNTLAITSELVKRGFNTMAHLTCVGADPAAISSFLQDLESAGIHNVLALRGDPPAHGEWDWNSAKFAHASDLVRYIKKYRPQMGVGVAAYPSPHPESPTFAEDRRFTAQKLDSGAEFAISQLFFDVREYIDLVDGLRENGIMVPVVPGILPIQSFEGLKRVLSLCGANIPGKLYLELEAANEKGGSEAVREVGVKFALKQIKALLEAGAPGIHLYTLNKSALSKRLITESGLA